MIEEILKIVKTLQNLTDDKQDGLLTVLIEMTIQSILNYCNICELPKELKFTVANMVVNSIKETQGDENSLVSSISEDGRSVSFDNSLIRARLDDSVKTLTELNRFRQVYSFRG